MRFESKVRVVSAIYVTCLVLSVTKFYFGMIRVFINLFRHLPINVLFKFCHGLISGRDATRRMVFASKVHIKT